ncbi:MAG: copper chaperone PCu(A)C [Chromatiales bacterium]|nr:copper chaperone PCu(A)C [Chromatiales bacterium]
MSRLVFAALILFSLSATADDVLVIDPWVAEAPPGARVVGGFMTLENRGDGDRSVTSVSSPAAREMQMHRTVFSEGMARMVPQESLSIPAHGRLVLEPGGYHLMLIGPTKPLAIGDQVPMQISLDDGTTLEVSAEVRPRPMGGGHEHHHH